MTLPSLETTPIPGLVVVRLDRRDDDRGFFKENWQREKMLAIGLPDFGPVQNNVSFNSDRGVTRGIHTEPWDKFVSLATGRIFGAWVDMREGETFGATFTLEMDTSVAVFVPRGVGNSYQVLEDATAYTYLVNEHWRPGIAYPALALDDDHRERRGRHRHAGEATPFARATGRPENGVRAGHDALAAGGATEAETMPSRWWQRFPPEPDRDHGSHRVAPTD